MVTIGTLRLCSTCIFMYLKLVVVVVWITTFTMEDSILLPVPWISIFSGNPNGATTYEHWRYDVDCLLRESYPRGKISEAIRRSLKGDASRVAMYLGPGAPIEQLLDKMESIYGTVECKESIYQEFYSARQKEDENVTDWGIRLENILHRAVRVTDMDRNDEDDMLRNMFWVGLKDSLKFISGHKFDSIQTFDELRVEIRRIEADQIQRQASQPRAKDKKSDKSKPDKAMKQLDSRIQQLSSQLENMNSLTSSYTQPVSTEAQQHSVTDVKMGYVEQVDYENMQPKCYRCGQSGHIAIGCRVIMDHSTKPNYLQRYYDQGFGSSASRRAYQSTASF